MRNNENQASESNEDLLEIQAARLAYIGASIAVIGDGVSAIAALLALQLLERQKAEAQQKTQAQQTAASQSRYYGSFNPGEVRDQMNYFINELIKVKNTI
ncbi:translation initiation factor 2 [Paenibacillus lycopersici]|uniref:Translation initiation factor 2 n=1 Tax=Paenibacillus lycopersici TaxID=2704462 RepID=A0A6C0FUX0_9BACL|nr:translation initiation factor 2 [Paenibacillus lycopersici]QHT60936.1 translation initiation factor 2 [Paenibacillus lycopersici]